MSILTAPHKVEIPAGPGSCAGQGSSSPNVENSLYPIIQHRAFKTSLGLGAAKERGHITVDTVMVLLCRLICLIVHNRKNSIFKCLEKAEL